MRMYSRLRRRGYGPSRAWSAQASLARDLSVRGWWGGAARGSHGRARGGGPAPGRSAPSSGVSASPRSAGGCGKPAPARDGPPGTGTAAGGRGTRGYVTWRRVILLAVLAGPFRR